MVNRKLFCFTDVNTSRKEFQEDIPSQDVCHHMVACPLPSPMLLYLNQRSLHESLNILYKFLSSLPIPNLKYFCFLIFCICTILHVNHSSLQHSSKTITNLLSNIYYNPPIRLRSNLRLYFIQRSLPKLQMSATQSQPISWITSGAIQYGVPITVFRLAIVS